MSTKGEHICGHRRKQLEETDRIMRVYPFTSGHGFSSSSSA
eukprot:CAMPEP_0115514834 /NCGR_PEP_ID=MMETSP0271-20121206/75874_1 /TAXON_ID=71861 /ORGANISM="Scrippsiella trochoidea, Strain CCMP3099" /LENGTH=40 /DNA_ID= /DNA_START= /DNA_END= /DNA_ORIENTATION=